MLSKAELRLLIPAEIERFKKEKKPVISSLLPSDNKQQKSIRVRPGFKHNGEPSGVFARMELFSVTWKNGRVMKNSYRPRNSEHIKALDCR